MTDLTQVQKAFFIKSYYTRGSSAGAALEAFRSKYKNVKMPSRWAFKRLIDKFEEKGTLLDMRKVASGRPAEVFTPENIERVRKYFVQHPRTSIRQGANILGFSYGSLQKILRKAIKLYPYKVTGVQRLSDYSKERRLEFTASLLGVQTGETFPVQQTVFSDEAHFWLDGYVNRQNYRIWGSENPNYLVDVSLHPQKVTCWAALSVKGVFMELFTETVTGERYNTLLTQKWFPFAERHNVINGWYFMQDGAPPHRTKDVFDTLQAKYGPRVIAYGYPKHTGSGIDWPPYSPDLNPCDYFLWGYIKDKVYANPIETVDQLKASIISAFQTIHSSMLERVISNFYKRVECCHDANGGHFEKHV